jgi:hypothetical protein
MEPADREGAACCQSESCDAPPAVEPHCIVPRYTHVAREKRLEKRVALMKQRSTVRVGAVSHWETVQNQAHLKSKSGKSALQGLQEAIRQLRDAQQEETARLKTLQSEEKQLMRTQ